jgi:hypothetical protein
MFEFRLRILEVGPGEYAGVVDGFPDFLVTGTSIAQTERDLVVVLVEQLRRLLNYRPVPCGLGEFPTVRRVRLFLRPTCD